MKATRLTEGIDDIVAVFEQAAAVEVARKGLEVATAEELAARNVLAQNLRRHSPRYLFDTINEGKVAAQQAFSAKK